MRCAACDKILTDREIVIDDGGFCRLCLALSGAPSYTSSKYDEELREIDEFLEEHDDE